MILLSDLSFPCVGVLIGLRGKDGRELWRVNTDSAVFLMNCEHIDVNQDGKTDCIVSGRQGTIAAINPKTGQWSQTGNTNSEAHVMPFSESSFTKLA